MNPDDNKLKSMGTQSKETMEKAAGATQDALRSTQQAVDRTANKMAGKVDDLRSQAAPAINKAADVASSVFDHAKETLFDTSQQLRDQAKKASDMAVSYTKDEPIKAMLIAAATGALLMGLITMMARSRT